MDFDTAWHPVKRGELPEYFLPVLVRLKEHTCEAHELNPHAMADVAIAHLVPLMDGFGDMVPSQWALVTSHGPERGAPGRYSNRCNLAAPLKDVTAWCHIPRPNAVGF